MDLEAAKKYLLAIPESVEDYPFGPEAAVYKIRGKMFALLCIRGGVPQMNLKCDPDEADMLRDLFPSVVPGYHMNKRHWNTIYLDGTVPACEIEGMLDKSFALVVKGMKKSVRDALRILCGEYVD